MLGRSSANQSDRNFDANVWKFATVAKGLMKSSAKLMSLLPSFADKWSLKVWKEFERSAQESIELCNDFNFNEFKFSHFNCLVLARNLILILSNDMESFDNGLLAKMKAAGLNEEMIVRIFSDLVIAAGDTASLFLPVLRKNL